MTSHSLSTTRTIRDEAVRGTAWLDWLRRVLQAVESRRHLAEMDDRMLSDIGISAQTRCGKPPAPRGI